MCPGVLATAQGMVTHILPQLACHLARTKELSAYTEAVAVMVLHRLRPHLLYLSLTKVQLELSKHTFEVSLFVSRKKDHARGFSSLHIHFLPSSQLL